MGAGFLVGAGFLAGRASSQTSVVCLRPGWLWQDTVGCGKTLLATEFQVRVITKFG